MTTLHLSDIAAGWDAVEAALEAGHGEITPEVAATLDALNLAEREKVDGYGLYLRSLEGRIAGMKSVEVDLAEKRKTLERRLEWLKVRVRIYLLGRRLKEVKGDIYRFALQKSGKPPVELLVPTDALPDDCRRVTVEPDKERIRAWLESGEPCTFARFGEGTLSLRLY